MEGIVGLDEHELRLWSAKQGLQGFGSSGAYESPF